MRENVASKVKVLQACSKLDDGPAASENRVEKRRTILTRLKRGGNGPRMRQTATMRKYYEAVLSSSPGPNCIIERWREAPKIRSSFMNSGHREKDRVHRILEIAAKWMPVVGPLMAGLFSYFNTAFLFLLLLLLS